MTILPDCMMPDGADPCAGYRQFVEKNESLCAEVAEYRDEAVESNKIVVRQRREKADLCAERDRLRELLSDIRAQGRITGDIAKRLTAALNMP